MAKNNTFIYGSGVRTPNNKENDADESNIVLDSSPSSPFLIPSFTRVSYLSEENNKVAKWRLHGTYTLEDIYYTFCNHY